ncbi:hypothetical protein HDV01_006737 [Terramyces sp. JEL0728]|nr:hypothetical protein HDV01_006737 [Terramyces sp. JEL0728]
MALVPTREQALRFLASPHKGPVHQVNFLKFKPKTKDGISGQESYEQYADLVYKLVKKAGGRFIWAGTPMKEGPLVGSTVWDRILIIEYPSKEAFVTMASSKEYKAIEHLRTDALENAQLIPAIPISKL